MGDVCDHLARFHSVALQVGKPDPQATLDDVDVQHLRHSSS